jgi:N4-gp56 family major capsid protein
MPGQLWSTSTLGGNWAVPYLTERLRHKAQPYFKLRQFIDVKEQVGKKRGDTWLFDKSGDVATQGGTLVETATIPETNYVTNQGTGTITEFGLSVPYTQKLDALGQFDIDSVTEMKLRDDQVKVLESAAGAQFAATDYIAVMSATNSVIFTTNGTATATASADLTAANVRSVVDFLLKRNVPKYDGQNYICVASVSAMSGMHADSGTGGWIDISKYTGEFAKNIFTGEVGTFYGVRFIQETGFLSNTIGLSSLRGQAVFFGADSVYEGVCIPEEIRMKVPQDFGRDMAMAWYALLGFKIVWNFAADAEQHIVFVTSA